LSIWLLVVVVVVVAVLPVAAVQVDSELELG
jgi:hypothetical protein